MMETTDDAALGRRLRLLQPAKGHRFGHDAILLAAATAAQDGDRVVDLGAGVGTAGLALARRVSGVRVTLIEIDPALAALAAENCARNALADRVNALALDATAPFATFAAHGLTQGSQQGVMMNPPFTDTRRHQLSPDAARRLAHASAPGNLRGWLETAKHLLAPDGVLTMIWRADDARGLLALLRADFACVVMAVHGRREGPAIRVLIRARRGTGQDIEAPPLILTQDDGRPTAAAEAVLRHAQALSFAPA